MLSATTVVIIAVVLLWRLWASLRKRGPSGKEKKKVLSVLGSGGHTTEMIYELSTLDKKKYQFVFVAAATDRGSPGKASKFMEPETADIRIVPRAREVGQSYFTSIFTTLRAFVSSAVVVFTVRPDLILTNGPGTCIPVIACGYILRFVGFHCSIMYSESLACVTHLSVSGRLAYHLADVFLVQWPALRKRFPKAVYAGRVPEGSDSSLPVMTETGGDGTAIVTVGSTQFDGLVKVCDDNNFLKALKDLGIKKIVIQRGSGSYEISQPVARCCEVMRFSPDIPNMMRTASLVISHAGAGTILDCLLNNVKMIVVPNETLMNNHQVQLAEALSEHGLLQWSRTSTLVQELAQKGTRPRTEFPKTPTSVFNSFVENL